MARPNQQSPVINQQRFNNQRSSNQQWVSLPRLAPEFCHLTVDLESRAIHAAERSVRHQAMPRIERHPLAARDAIGIVEALPRDANEPDPVIWRIARLPL